MFVADVQASRLQEYLAGLRRPSRVLPALDPDAQTFTKAEVAAALGSKHRCVTALVQRHGLAATGKGKARRFPRSTVDYLRTHLSRGKGTRASNFALGAVKAFFRWLVRDRRTAVNPLPHLRGGNVAADRRCRRPLLADELRRLIEAARKSARTFRGLASDDRAALYATATGTGVRAEELSTLRPSAFALDTNPPTVTLRPEDSKNGRGAVQPLASDLADALREYLGGRPINPSGPVPGGRRQPTWSGPTWKWPASPSSSMGRKAPCSPISTRCDTASSPS